MDKNTLSNYGWIVIAVLVLAVMIALATPFGKYVESGVKSTTEGLFSTSENAMNTAFGDMGVQVEKPTFEEVDEALTCEHNFMPVDSTGLTLACTKCGFVVKRKEN